MSNDRISNLPDSCLHNILSFLPTKDVVVATTLLSKRWRPLWHSTPFLDFNDELYTQNKTQYCRFVQFVLTVLLTLSRDVQPLKRFRLQCCSNFTSDSNVNIWINHVIQRQVEHLEINIQAGPRICLSSSVFTCKTLVVLKLNELQVGYLPSVCLPSLKVLHLESVNFHSISDVHKILSACSSLLENLILKCIFHYHFNSNIHQYHQQFVKRFCETFSKLISADVGGTLVSWEALHMAQFLCLRLGSYHYGIPTFPNLVHLELNMFEHNWNVLAQILQTAPKLQILVILKKLITRRNYKTVAIGHLDGGTRISSSFRKCHMVGFEGDDFELQFAKYIMENAKALRTLEISTSKSLDSDSKFQIIKKLSSYTRISPTCQLLFES